MSLKNVRIPRKFRKVEGGQVEVRMPIRKDDFPFYDVRHVDGVVSKFLARIVVSGGPYKPSAGEEYEIYAFDRGDKRKFLGEVRGFGEADSLAHRTAVSIGLRIANYSNVPLEDFSREDRARLERM